MLIYSSLYGLNHTRHKALFLTAVVWIIATNAGYAYIHNTCTFSEANIVLGEIFSNVFSLFCT